MSQDSSLQTPQLPKPSHDQLFHRVEEDRKNNTKQENQVTSGRHLSANVSKNLFTEHFQHMTVNKPDSSQGTSSMTESNELH